MTNEIRQQEADQPFVQRYAYGNPVAKAIVEFPHQSLHRPAPLRIGAVLGERSYSGPGAANRAF